MKLIFDPHTHTSYSHGKNTVLEMVRSAHDKGLKGIDITEHGPNHFYARNIGYDGYVKMRQEVDEAKKLYPDMTIRFGVEANIISEDGDLDLDEKLIELFDVVNAGFHMMCKMKDVKSFFKLLFKAILIKNLHMTFLKKGAYKTNTKACVNAIRKNHIDMLTHPTSNYDCDIVEVAKACVETGTILEINNPRKLMDESRLELVKDFDLKYMVGSDAHNVDDVARVDNSFQIIEKAGLDISRVINVE